MYPGVGQNVCQSSTSRFYNSGYCRETSWMRMMITDKAKACREIENVELFSRESDSRSTNVRLSVCYQNPQTA